MIDNMGDIGEPWGMPFTTDFESEMRPSRQIAASLSERNGFTHLTVGNGIRF